MLLMPSCGGFCDAANKGRGSVGLLANPGNDSGVEPYTRLSNTSTVDFTRMSSDTLSVGSRRKRMFIDTSVCVSSFVVLHSSPGKLAGSPFSPQRSPSKGRYMVGGGTLDVPLPTPPA